MSGGLKTRSVVALGGGHGLAATLRAVRRYARDVTAVVSVADDGGSSGRLREAFGLPAPGDLRCCLEALAEPDSVWASAFEHRFAVGELDGHALGNLLIIGLAEALGSFEAALKEVSRLLGVTGRVLPATVGPVVLKADIDGRVVVGQREVGDTEGPITSVSVVPPDATTSPEVVSAIVDADQVVLGPGSLFTSVLACCVIPGISDALGARTAGRIYVANLRPQIPETEGFDLEDHLDALDRHRVPVDVVVYDPANYPAEASRPRGRARPAIIEASLARADGLGHDPIRLGRVLADLAGA